MANPEFKYQHPFPLGKDETEYYLLTKDYVSVGEFEGHEILKVEKEGLTAMANAAFHDVSFMLRRSHNLQVAKILSDPEASENDKYVALTFLRNADVASKGLLPFCQDTGTAIIHGEKGQQVWTGYCDEEALSYGVYKTYTENNLRYSQNAPLTMYEEVNTKCNLPAQIDLEAAEGMEYKFLCVAKGGGSANKTYLFQETKAILNPETLVPFLVEKMKTLGTAACPPYHIAFVIGGTSAEKNLLTVKLASTHYYDSLPTSGNEYGRAFRDVELEKQVLEAAHNMHYGVAFAYVRKEFVAQTFPVRSSLYKPCNIYKFNYRGRDLFTVVKGGKLIQPFVGYGNYAHVGFDCAKGIVCGLCARMGYGIKKCRFANVWQTYDA